MQLMYAGKHSIRKFKTRQSNLLENSSCLSNKMQLNDESEKLFYDLVTTNTKNILFHATNDNSNLLRILDSAALLFFNHIEHIIKKNSNGLIQNSNHINGVCYFTFFGFASSKESLRFMPGLEKKAHFIVNLNALKILIHIYFNIYYLKPIDGHVIIRDLIIQIIFSYPVGIPFKRNIKLNIKKMAE